MAISRRPYAAEQRLLDHRSDTNKGDPLSLIAHKIALPTHYRQVSATIVTKRRIASKRRKLPSSKKASDTRRLGVDNRPVKSLSEISPCNIRSYVFQLLSRSNITKQQSCLLLYYRVRTYSGGEGGKRSSTQRLPARFDAFHIHA